MALRPRSGHARTGSLSQRVFHHEPYPPSSPVTKALTRNTLLPSPTTACRQVRLLSPTLLPLALYFSLNLLLTLYNKLVLVRFPFPYTLTALHALAGTFGAYLLVYPPTTKDIIDLLHTTCLFVLTVLRLLLTPLEYALQHKAVPAPTWLARYTYRFRLGRLWSRFSGANAHLRHTPINPTSVPAAPAYSSPNANQTRTSITATTHDRLDLSPREMLIICAFSVLYTVNIVVSNVSLGLVTVPFHQVVRSSAPFFTIALSAVMLGQRASREKILSLVPVIVGVGFATYGDYYFTPWGFALTLLGTLLAALKTIITHVLQAPAKNTRASAVPSGNKILHRGQYTHSRGKSSTGVLRMQEPGTFGASPSWVEMHGSAGPSVNGNAHVSGIRNGSPETMNAHPHRYVCRRTPQSPYSHSRSYSNTPASPTKPALNASLKLLDDNGSASTGAATIAGDDSFSSFESFGSSFDLSVDDRDERGKEQSGNEVEGRVDPSRAAAECGQRSEKGNGGGRPAMGARAKSYPGEELGVTVMRAGERRGMVRMRTDSVLVGRRGVGARDSEADVFLDGDSSEATPVLPAVSPTTRNGISASASMSSASSLGSPRLRAGKPSESALYLTTATTIMSTPASAQFPTTTSTPTTTRNKEEADAMQGRALLRPLSPLDLLLLTSPLAFIQCVLIAHFSGELDQVRHYSLHEMNRTKTVALFANGLIAFGLNVVSFSANRRVGALGMSVAGNVKQVLTILIAVVLFDLTITGTNALGIVLTLLGGAWYARVEYLEKEARR